MRRVRAGSSAAAQHNSLTHSLTHSPTHSLAHALTHLLTHSLTAAPLRLLLLRLCLRRLEDDALLHAAAAEEREAEQRQREAEGEQVVARAVEQPQQRACGR